MIDPAIAAVLVLVGVLVLVACVRAILRHIGTAEAFQSRIQGHQKALADAGTDLAALRNEIAQLRQRVAEQAEDIKEYEREIERLRAEQVRADALDQAIRVAREGLQTLDRALSRAG